MSKLIPAALLLLMLTVECCTPGYIKQYEDHLLENPGTQLEIDRNKIINYAITHELELENTASGIYYTLQNPGTGEARPNDNSMVKAHYKGYFLNGEKFDSSYDRNEPLEFQLGQVIKGWQEAIKLLGKGGKGTFLIPSTLAYGSKELGPIPANSVLIFDIELLDF